MAKIKAFKAVIYNQEKIKDLSSVICPPYDVISEQEQKYYHEKSPYNFIHILLGRDIVGEDKYQRSADYFKEWLKDEILIPEEKPCVYFYSQEYYIRGEKRSRFGFVSLLKLGERDSSVFGHENTQPSPKEDRLKILKRVKANLSPIFAVFSDKKRIIQRIYEQEAKIRGPLINVTDKEKTTHKIWRIDSSAALTSIESALSCEIIFIADGHHRYEVACAFRDEMKKKLGLAYTGDEDFNYMLTYFTNTDPRGLLILPIHRLVMLDEGMNLKDFILGLKEYFDIDEVKDGVKFFFLLEKCGRSEHVIGMYYDKTYQLLRLKNIKILEKVMGERPKEYRSLDVSILNSLILKKITQDPKHGKNITFSPDAQDFINKVKGNAMNIAFFLNPAKIEQIIAIALKGERMPPKSTYFYPKVLSGLLINKFQ